MYHHMERTSCERQTELQEQAAALRLAREAETSGTVTRDRALPVRLGAGSQSLMRAWVRWMPRPAGH
jgi:hypothetical protein